MPWTPRSVAGAPTRYHGIVEALESDVADGKVQPGEKLPPQRTVAKALGVDLTTVTRAFNEARRRGLIEAQSGRGTFISALADGRGTPADPGSEIGIDLSMNIPPQPGAARMQQRIVDGMTELLRNPGGLLRYSYQESTGHPADRQAAALWLRDRLGDVGSSRIAVAAGAQAALFALCTLLLRPGETLAAAAMTYPGLKAVAMQCRLTLAAVEIDGDGIIPESFAELCDRAAPQALYVVSSIDNPTTATLPLQRRQALIEIARRYAVRIIEDDPYAPLLAEPVASIAALAPEITWHLATLSKSATPALRVAHVVAPDPAQALELAGVLRATTLMAPPLMTALASRWIADGSLAAIVTAIREENRRRQALAATILDPAMVAMNPQGPHLWMRLPEPWQADDFARRAAGSGIAIVPGSAFAIAPPRIEAVRLSLGAVLADDTLREALRRLSAFMANRSLAPYAIV